MKADAIKEAATIAATGAQPPKELQNAALAEVLDIALGFFSDVRRIADAIDNYVMHH